MKLEDPSTIKALWLGFIVVLAILLALEPLVEHHTHFKIDGTWWFSAWYGFGACFLMVVISKLVVGAVLKRKDTYYDD